MTHHFALTIHLHDQRYHGAVEWPPAPARVFQALMAGAAHGRHVPPSAARALKFFEGVAPVIAAPNARRGQRLSVFVPNNDLDAVAADPDRVGEVRVKKTVQPYLLEGPPTFLYAWPLRDADGEALSALAVDLYQFGRGMDPAWAIGEVISEDELDERLWLHRGTVHRPTRGAGANELAVPSTNSFESLVRRFESWLVRLRPSDNGTTRFVQPPKAQFTMVGYDGAAPCHLFVLRSESEPTRASPWPAWRAASLTERVRDTAVEALSAALPDRKNDIARVLIGRRPDRTNAGPIEERVRFIPLPSIGHEHADLSIRRVLVQAPAGPVSQGDILWALAGRPLIDAGTGVLETTLASQPDDDVVEQYRASARTWRSVTPLALGSAMRRRIAPDRRREEAKPAGERQREEDVARHEVARALRQAGVAARLVRAHVQREPFEARGTRAERFAQGTRFPKEALWHVELELDRDIRGPLVLGDGRFLGLGVMAPRNEGDAFVLQIEAGLPPSVDTRALARALRRAVMSRLQVTLGARGETELPPYFHGHASNGEPMRAERSTHLAFSVDLPRSRLLVIPPHVLDGWRQPPRAARFHLDTLSRALRGFTELRAGSSGVLSLRIAKLSSDDSLFGESHVFRSILDYLVTRHPKRVSAEEAVSTDVRCECERRSLPKPEEVRVVSVRGVPGVGVAARVEIVFRVAVRGPLLLGKSRYLGGGLFEPVKDSGRCDSRVDRK